MLAVSAFRLPADDGVFQRIVKSLVSFYGTSLPEKAYLHLDRPFYASGETVWFKAYVVEADSHRPDTLSKVLYVDLLSPRQRVVAQRTLRLSGGLAHGDLALPDTLATGTYQLRAYTSWMRNASPAFFFTRALAIARTAAQPAPAPAANARIDLQFFPEGGNLVEELESEVGFKAVDGQGHGVALQGTVLDEQGQPVASLNTRHGGMGSFRLTPAPGQRYRAVVVLPGGGKAEYPLPTSQPTGYTLHVSETADDFVVVLRRRMAAGAAPAGPALLMAQVRGSVAFAAQAPLTGTAPITAMLPKAKFVPGLAHITLFDEQGTAQCERLVFVPNPPGIRLTLAPDKPSYATREAVRLKLTATDAAGQPVAGAFSVAVSAPSSAFADGPTIASHLLLSSDLAGPVEDPGYYFREPQTPEIRQALNDLLLTQGWRRFVWKELLAGQLPSREFALEQGLSVSGQVLTAAGTPAGGRQVAYLQTNPTREAQMQTDASGRFLFRGLDGLDTTHVMLRAPSKKGEEALRIRLPAPPPAQAQPNALLAATAFSTALGEYARRSAQQQAQARSAKLSQGKTIALEEVSVRGARPRVVADGAMRPYSNANAVVLQVKDDVVNDSKTLIQYLAGRVAGVVVTGSTVNIRQASTLQNQSGGSFLIEPLFLIDGAIVSGEAFAAYPLKEIQTIDVMNQSAAGLFGSQAYGGVIAAYSRQGKDGPAKDPKAAFVGSRGGFLSFQMPGYYRAREFYAPRYEAAAPVQGPDPRLSTLYWLPEVRTDARGQAQLSFFAADAVGTFQATAEGVTTQGTPMRGTATFVVRKALAK
ncbi:Plug domain-containing protein [Hymenobacter humi]